STASATTTRGRVAPSPPATFRPRAGSAPGRPAQRPRVRRGSAGAGGAAGAVEGPVARPRSLRGPVGPGQERAHLLLVEEHAPTDLVVAEQTLPNPRAQRPRA